MTADMVFKKLLMFVFLAFAILCINICAKDIKGAVIPATSCAALQLRQFSARSAEATCVGRTRGSSCAASAAHLRLHAAQTRGAGFPRARE